VIKADNTADLRPVKVGIVEGDSTSLDSGLEAGETVVTDGADKIQPGSAVTVPGTETGTTKAKGAGKRTGPEK
jgi:hypothetical protein